MLSYNEDLRVAHILKEKLLKITISVSSSVDARILLKEWINFAFNSGIKEFQSRAKTYIRYF